jgi:hypothetical protein
MSALRHKTRGDLKDNAHRLYKGPSRPALNRYQRFKHDEKGRDHEECTQLDHGIGGRDRAFDGMR